MTKRDRSHNYGRREDVVVTLVQIRLACRQQLTVGAQLRGR